MPCQQYTAIDTILVSPLAFVATLLLLILAIVTNSSAPLAPSGSNLHPLILTVAPGDRCTLDSSHPLSTIGSSFAAFTLLAAITLSGLCSLAGSIIPALLPLLVPVLLTVLHIPPSLCCIHLWIQQRIPPLPPNVERFSSQLNNTLVLQAASHQLAQNSTVSCSKQKTTACSPVWPNEIAEDLGRMPGLPSFFLLLLGLQQTPLYEITIKIKDTLPEEVR